MSTHEEQQMGDATLADLIKQANDHHASSLPVAGGDYDTMLGWYERFKPLGVSELGVDRLVKMLIDQGLAKRCRGRVPRGDSWYTVTLIHSPVLAGKCHPTTSA